MKQFVERESFKHKFAKELLHQWLNDGGFDDYKCGSAVMEHPLRKTPNQAKPTKVADIAAFANGSSHVQRSVDSGAQPHAIFEIYHTHRIEPAKLNALTTYWPDLKIYEICADLILNLTKKPATILDLTECMKGRTKRGKRATKTYMHSQQITLAQDNRYDRLA